MYTQYLKTSIERYIKSINKYKILKTAQILPDYSSYKYKKVIEFFKNNIKGKVLLLGCGNNFLTEAINPDVCFDIDYSISEYLKGKIKFENLLGVHTSYKDDFFDTVVISDFLKEIFYYHISFLFKEVYRISKKVLFATTLTNLEKILTPFGIICKDTMESFINWMGSLGISREEIQIKKENEFIFLIVKKIRNKKEERINLFISLDLEKPSEVNLYALEMGLSLSDYGCNVHFEQAKRFELPSDFYENPPLPKINYLNKEEKKKVFALIKNNIRFTQDSFFEIPISRVKTFTPKVIRWFDPLRLGFFPSEYIEFLNKDVDIVWHFSEWTHKYFIENGGNPSKSFIVPLGVNTTIFCPASKGSDSEQYTFLGVGLPFKESGIDILLESFCEEFTDKDKVKLQILFLPLEIEEVKGFFYTSSGWNFYKKYENQYKTLYYSKIDYFRKKYLKDKKNAPKIDIKIAPVNVRERAKYFKNCNCYLHLYRCDFRGDKLMQAMACAKPVITVDKFFPLNLCNRENIYIIKSKIVSAVEDEIVPFSEYYFWIKPLKENVKKMMRYVYEHREEAFNKGLAARRDILNKWTWKISAQKAIRSILSLSNNKNKTSSKNYLSIENKKLHTLFQSFLNKGLLHSYS